ncbi:hypothetical protein H0H92_015134 [Tricholoma furcatifolium]|nr:hypothetical protein H0H92_015134 [Tricholoma furcatifolium]
MDEEHDILDWGAEDDEAKNQDLTNDAVVDAPCIEGDNDDFEDAVSLGDEDEEQEYYSYQQEELTSSGVKAESGQTKTAPHSTDTGDTPSTSREAQLDESSTQVGSSHTGTPRRASSSGHRSPQRSLMPRITHALPPKPVVTAVTFAHHSHPSIVEATAMSVATRTPGRSKGKTATTADDLDPLPRGWEAREARSGAGGTYYYNARTNESTWTRPTQEPSRQSRRTQPPNHTNSQPETDLNSMSYDDRHYRPGGGADGQPASRGTNDRLHSQEEVDPRFNPHPDRAFTPSPRASPSRDRNRSLSPQPLAPARGRESRPSRTPRSSRGGRNINTDADFSSNRDRDSHSGAYQDSWVANDTFQESRRTSHQHYEISYDISMDDSRPPMPPRNGSTRGRREREPPLRDESRIPDMPDSRTRSPPPDKRDLRANNDDEYRGRKNDRLDPPPPPRGQEDYQTKSSLPVSSQFSAPPPPQRRRERPTRFGQPSSSTSMQPSVQPSTDAPQAPPHRRVEEDDPYVPDDIKTQQELPQKTMVREKFSRIQAAIGLLPTEEERDHPQSGQRQSFDQSRQDSSSEQPTRRLRPPLPPQSAEFQGLAARPREARERPPRPPPNRVTRHQGANHDDEMLARPHIQRRSPDIPPTLPSYSRYDDYNETVQATTRRRTVDLDADDDNKLSRLPKQAEGEGMKRESNRRGSIEMGPPTTLSVGPGSYPAQSYASREPRGASSLVDQRGPPSPVNQTGPNLRHLERSPPPHMRAREMDNDGGRDGYAQRGARRERGRANDYPRGPPGAASGTNNIPIGNQRKLFGDTNAGPPVPSMRTANNPNSLRASRGGGGKGRGGAPREQQFDRTQDDGYGDKFRASRAENDGPPTRQRNGSLPPFERRQPLNVDTRASRERDHLSISPVETRFEPASADLARMPRTWTPRGEAPPEAFLVNNTGKEHSTSPLLDRASVAVETGRPPRYHTRDGPGSSRGPSHPDGRPPPKERFARQFDEPRRNGGLEGRLSDRFDDHATMPVRQTHALPPNPYSTKTTRSPDAARRPYNPPVDKQLNDTMAPLSSQGYSSRSSADGYPPDHDMDAPPHPHSNMGGEDSYTGRRWRSDSRPDMSRRPSSLLERLDLPADGNDFREDTSYTRSLSDRVQVPSKRDRDDMNGDRYGGEESFDGEDTDPAMKRARRKTTKPRKPKRAML